VLDLDDYEDVVIDEAFARSKGCAMPELVNLLDDPEVLIHLKVIPTSEFNLLLFFVENLDVNKYVFGNLFYSIDVCICVKVLELMVL